MHCSGSHWFYHKSSTACATHALCIIVLIYGYNQGRIQGVGPYAPVGQKNQLWPWEQIWTRDLAPLCGSISGQTWNPPGACGDPLNFQPTQIRVHAYHGRFVDILRMSVFLSYCQYSRYFISDCRCCCRYFKSHFRKYCRYNSYIC